VRACVCVCVCVGGGECVAALPANDAVNVLTVGAGYNTSDDDVIICIFGDIAK